MNAQQMSAALLPTKDVCSGVACAGCMSQRDGLLACSACKHASYCNKACQSSNWKNHKGVCKVLQAFRTILPNIEEAHHEPFRPGMLGLHQKFHFFKTICQNPSPDLAHVLRMIKMPKHMTDKIWTETYTFLSSARCCSVCNKTEYDVPIGESRNWINCKTCKFSWCCSKEHWDEYKDRHTREICRNYRECISVDRFRYKHVINHGDTFLHMPQTVCTEILDPLPRNWKQYFARRCAQEYSMKSMLPKEYFPAATHSLSQPVNCLYGMYEHDKEFFTTTKSLTVHVVGAAFVYEMVGGGPNCVWEELMHCLPAVEKMNIAFVGPEATSCFADKSDTFDADISCCPDCVGKSRSRTQTFSGKTYHEFVHESEGYTKADFIVAFNTGLFEEDTESWKTSLEVMLDLDIPCLFTSYNEFEADGDYKVISELGARMLTEGPVLNPFSVDYQEIDASEVDTFFKQNMYCICFRGRKE